MMSWRWLLPHYPTNFSISSLYSLSLLIVWDTSNNGGVVRELLQVACLGVISEVRGVEGEQKRWKNSASVACHHIWQAVSQPDILWPVCEVVYNPCHQVLLDLHHWELLSQPGWLDCVVILSVILSSVKQTDDGILHVSLVRKLQWVQAVAHQGPDAAGPASQRSHDMWH